ncbi:hypothetical protein ScPMuIL_011446 [Solemya velum]
MAVSARFRVSSVALGVIAILLIVGGVVAPGWIVIADTYYVGLWNVVFGHETDSAEPMVEYMGLYGLSWRGVQAEATISMILGLLGLICTVVYVSSREPAYKRSLVMLAALCYLISGLLIGAAMVQCLVYLIDVSGHTRLGTPFSMIMCSIGVAIECICAVMHFREFCLCKATPGVVHHIQPSQGFADPPAEYSVTVHSTQMAQYPAPMENQPTPADCRDDKYLIQA